MPSPIVIGKSKWLGWFGLAQQVLTQVQHMKHCQIVGEKKMVGHGFLTIVISNMNVLQNSTNVGYSIYGQNHTKKKLFLYIICICIVFWSFVVVSIMNFFAICYVFFNSSFIKRANALILELSLLSKGNKIWVKNEVSTKK